VKLRHYLTEIRGFKDSQKRYSGETALKILREIGVHLYDGLDVVSPCRKAGILDKT
jgi:hypothetical protein